MATDNMLQAKLSRIESIVANIQTIAIEWIQRNTSVDRHIKVDKDAKRLDASTQTCDTECSNVSNKKYDQIPAPAPSTPNKHTPSTKNVGDQWLENKKRTDDVTDAKYYKAEITELSAAVKDELVITRTPIDLDNTTNENIAEDSVPQSGDACENKSIDGSTTKSTNKTGANDIIQTSINRLSDRISGLETAIAGNMSAIKGLVATRKPRGYYENWGRNHQLLASAAFVPIDAYMNALSKVHEMIHLSYVGERAINKILDSLPVYKVSRTKRFPDDGFYINIEHINVHVHIENLRDNAVCNVRHGFSDQSVSDILEKLKSYAENSQQLDPDVSCVLYDLNKFEIALKWVDE